MRIKRLLSVILAAVIAIPAVYQAPCMIKVARADNPIIQTYFTADPSPMVVGDTLYLVTSHDEDVLEENKPMDNYKFFTMKNWKCYSTKDMVNWTDHGTIFGQDSFEWGHTWCYRAWAAQFVERNGKYYLYVPALRKENYGEDDIVRCSSSDQNAMEVVEDDYGDGYDINKMLRKSYVQRLIPDIEVGDYVKLIDSPGYGIGVAVSDNPYGPYEDAIGKPLIEGNWYDIDPTVFVDDDGQAYLFYGQTLKYALLGDDMISLKTEPKNFSVPNYVEGPWFTKHDGTYYFMYAARGGNTSAHKGDETIHYAYCDTPLGKYVHGGLLQETLKGVVDEKGEIRGSFTNHPGVCDFKGHSYLFYHTTELPGGCGESSGAHRSVCVAEFEYNDDKTIDVVGMPDSVEPIGTLDPYNRVEAETICWSEGLKTGSTINEAGYNDVYVYNMHDGDFNTVRNVDFGSAGAKEFRAVVKDVAGDSDAKIEIYLDKDESPVAVLNVTGVSDSWKELTVKLDRVITGIHDVRFAYKGNENYKKPSNETGLSRDENAYIHEEDTGMFKFDSWQFSDTVSMPTAMPESNAPTATAAVTATNSPKPTATAPATAAPTVKPKPSIPAPDRVKITSAKGGRKKITVRWKKISGVTGYTLQYSTSKGFKKAVKNLSTRKTSLTLKNLKSKSTYYVRVCAYITKSDKKLDGKYSYVKKVKVK